MSRAPALLAWISAAALLGGALLIPAQETQEQVEKIFDRIEESKGALLWEGIRQLEALGRGSLEDIRKGFTRADGFVRIAAAKVLYANEHRDQALEALAKVASGKNPAARKAAADMSASLVAADTTLNAAEKRRIARDLQRQAEQAEDPLTQVSLWRAVWHLAPAGIEPIRKLRDIINASERLEVREEAALALAEMDKFIEAKTTLGEMAKEPGDRGRLARAYLKIQKYAENASRGLEIHPKYDFRLLEEAIDVVKQHYHDESKVVPEKMVEAAVRGAVGSLDPYTVYMDEVQIRQLKEEELGGMYGGIGARVSMRKDKGGNSWLTIEEPIFSGPAYRIGLRSGDRIIDVEGEATVNRELSDLVRKLRGKPATPVRIKVWRRGWIKEREFTITREQIRLETTTHRTLPGGLGYIKLSTFGEQDIELVEQAIKDMEGMKSLIFDLRGNSGGYLRTATKLASYFLERGQIVVSTRGRGMSQDRKFADGSKLTDVPLVVLVDEGSASASEILAGSLQDHKRAVLVGEKTFGKGSVQDMKYLKTAGEKTAVKVTISKWHLPSDRSVEKDTSTEGGVTPDVKAEPPERDFWKDAEFERLRAGDEIYKYVKELHESDAKLLQGLAESDGGDVSRYPKFETLYEALRTKASKDEIRELVRESIRRRVQDEILKKPLYMDFQTDYVLQRGILEACRLAQVDPKTLHEYAIFTRDIEAKAER